MIILKDMRQVERRETPENQKMRAQRQRDRKRSPEERKAKAD